MFKIALICGGTSLERGISLNSARCVMDHLSDEGIEIVPLYVDYQKRFYSISCAQLYSNTPADFDFKLQETAEKLDEKRLDALLKSVDLVFPVIHGPYGEDGQIQELLEKLEVPFIGSSSYSCSQMFLKHKATEILKENGFSTLPFAVLRKGSIHNQKIIEDFFAVHCLDRAVVKPVSGGSSIGVFSVCSTVDAMDRCDYLFDKGFDTEVMIEPFCKGKEFTVVVFENLKEKPVALIPTEIEISYDNNQIFDYRKKYLPTSNVVYHTPPRFEENVLKTLRSQSEKIFKLFHMNDFVRLDGWVMPDNTIYFSDFNPVSGLEQNSFLFRQAAVLGMTHKQALQYVLRRACQRYQLQLPEDNLEMQSKKMPVFVLFGGKTSERQVSLMSGTNVWLKLLRSSKHDPSPYFYDVQGEIWKLPYSYTLNHTVEEIYDNCLRSEAIASKTSKLAETVHRELGIEKEVNHRPQKMSLEYFLKNAKEKKAFVFIAMHGGEGEDGTLQQCLEQNEIIFNGSDSKGSALCMDKYLTGEAINSLSDPDILTLTKKLVSTASMQNLAKQELLELWQTLTSELQISQLIIKPRADGCSSGIVLLQSECDLERYFNFVRGKAASIPAGSFPNQNVPIEMPSSCSVEYIIEPYIETDDIVIQKNSLFHKQKNGWIELTVGVLEQNGIYHSLNPSITIAEGAVLSLEEKFQGGTGVNITPPPVSIISFEATQKIKRLIEKAAGALKIKNYARIDIFFNRITEKLIIIEANTLPGLTPSTVIYHQGLAEDPPLPPTAFLDRIISSKYT